MIVVRADEEGGQEKKRKRETQKKKKKKNPRLGPATLLTATLGRVGAMRLSIRVQHEAAMDEAIASLDTRGFVLY